MEEALAALHRAISAYQFYPEGHPMLEEGLAEGFAAWQRVSEDPRWKEPGLSVKGGGLWFGAQRLGEGSPALSSLARTLISHRLVGVRVSGTLSAEGFRRWMALLAAAPDLHAEDGGAAGIWKRSAHAADLELRPLSLAAGVSEQRHPSGPAGDRDWGDRLSDARAVAALSDPLLTSRLQSFQQKSPKERRLLDLLLRLGRTDDMAAFLDLLREITHSLEGFLEVERYREPFLVVLYLYREAQNMEALGKENKKDYLLDTIRLVVRGSFLQWMISLVASARGDEEAEVGEYVLRGLGKGAAVPLLNALVSEKSRSGRRRLIEVLVSIGDPVVPWVVKMLDDQRWYVVRNMVTILGGIGSPQARRALIKRTGEPDGRIRKEVARALGRVGGAEAEEKLLELLRDRDLAVRIMAITAASSLRTERMIEGLWQCYRDIPIRAGEWELKPEILQAIGRSGSREVVEPLGKILRKKPILNRRRWLAVQRAAVQALGDVGGAEAEALLEPLREHPDAEFRATAVRALAAARGQLGVGL